MLKKFLHYFVFLGMLSGFSFRVQANPSHGIFTFASYFCTKESQKTLIGTGICIGQTLASGIAAVVLGQAVDAGSKLAFEQSANLIRDNFQTPFFWGKILWQKPEPNKSMSSLRFNKPVQDQLNAYLSDLEAAVINGKGVPNALFYGPKGVGKSQFMERLARRMHKDVLTQKNPGLKVREVRVGILPVTAMLNTAMVTKNEQIANGVAALFQEMFEYLERQSKVNPNVVYIIVVDECEKYFEFKQQDDSHHWIKIFIEKLGSRQANYSFLFASNSFPETFDAGFLTRMDHEVGFELPNFLVRKELLRQSLLAKVEAAKQNHTTVFVEGDFLAEPFESRNSTAVQAKTKAAYLASLEADQFENLLHYNKMLQDMPPLVSRAKLAKLYERLNSPEELNLNACIKEGEYNNYTDNVSFLDALALRTACFSGRELQQFVDSIYIAPVLQGEGASARIVAKHKYLSLSMIVETLQQKMNQYRPRVEMTLFDYAKSGLIQLIARALPEPTSAVKAPTAPAAGASK